MEASWFNDLNLIKLKNLIFIVEIMSKFRYFDILINPSN